MAIRQAEQSQRENVSTLLNELCQHTVEVAMQHNMLHCS